MELASLEQIISEEDIYILHVKIPKSAYLAWKMAFEALEGIAKDVHYKHRLADERSRARQAEWDKERAQRFQAIKDKIRLFYKEHLNHGLTDKEAMKKVTVMFKDYSWLRKEFRDELRAKRDLEVIKLHKEGLNSKEVSKKTGVPSPTVRKIILNFSETGV